ncbi:MAG: CoB--CoM heterodisulfide reductase iron-sulfur subunit B family protein [Candidatus Bathyarchaeales archaeon]
MKVAVFWGCRILTSQYAYEISARETFPRLNVELADLPETNCCGEPVKSIKESAADYLAARILALTNVTGLSDLLVPCNRCHFALSETMERLRKDDKTSKKIIDTLKEEGLSYNSKIKIWHTIDFLHDFIGIDKVKRAVQKPLKGLKLATHVGCQIIRYSNLGRIDDSENPQKLNKLVNALGAEVVGYPKKLDCCGGALMRSHPDAALSLAGIKLNILQGLAVDGLVISCPECGLMFDSKQKEAAAIVGAKLNLPVIYYTQLLGLALKIEKEKLGLQLNQSSVNQFLAKV